MEGKRFQFTQHVRTFATPRALGFGSSLGTEPHSGQRGWGDRSGAPRCDAASNMPTLGTLSRQIVFRDIARSSNCSVHLKLDPMCRPDAEAKLFGHLYDALPRAQRFARGGVPPRSARSSRGRPQQLRGGSDQPRSASRLANRSRSATWIARAFSKILRNLLAVVASRSARSSAATALR